MIILIILVALLPVLLIVSSFVEGEDELAAWRYIDYEVRLAEDQIERIARSGREAMTTDPSQSVSLQQYRDSIGHGRRP